MNQKEEINRHFICSNGNGIAVGTFYCIGRNYSAHAKEMGAEIPAKPLVFIKPPSAFMQMENCAISRPSYSNELHHEIEIAIVIGEDIPEHQSTNFSRFITGYGLALDLTLRDVQSLAKQKGEPWAISKSFKHSAPVSTIIVNELWKNEYPSFTFSLDINGERKQSGNTDFMERSFEQLIAYCHSIFSLRRGDCILTGTPEGVGPLQAGDQLTCSIDALKTVHCSVI